MFILFYSSYFSLSTFEDNIKAMHILNRNAASNVYLKKKYKYIIAFGESRNRY